MTTQPRIFVTGGTGFLGSYLLRALLQQGYSQVKALCRPLSSLDLVADIAHRIEWVEGDLLDGFMLEEALQDVDWVFHAAAHISFLPQDRRLMHQVNAEGTGMLVNACLYSGVKKLLYVSTIAALGFSKPDQVCDEKSTWLTNPYNSEYGLSKFLGEQEVWRGAAEGLSVFVVNPSIILGPRHWHKGSGRFFSKIDEGLNFFPSGLANLVDVHDVVRMCLQLMESSLSDERFIANGTTVSYQHFFRLIADAMGVSPPQYRITRLMGEIAWRFNAIWSLMSGKPPLLTRENIRQSELHIHYNQQKSISKLDFVYTPLEQSVNETVRAYLDFKTKNNK
jgi:dihydroflavonol-4-reductase